MRRVLLIFALVIVGAISIDGYSVFPKKSIAANTENKKLTIAALKPSPDHKWMVLELESLSDTENVPDSWVRIVANDHQQKYFFDIKPLTANTKKYFRELPIGWKNANCFIVARFSPRDKDNNLVSIIQITVPAMREETIAQFVSAKTLFQKQNAQNGSMENFTLHPECDALLFTRNILPSSNVKDIPSPADIANLFATSFQRVYRLGLTSKQVTALGDLPPNYRCSGISHNCFRAANQSLLVVATPVKDPPGNHARVFSLQDNQFIKSAISSESASTRGFFSPDDSKIAFALPPFNQGFSASGKVQIMETGNPQKQKTYSTSSSVQQVEWSADNHQILVYSQFAEKPTLSIIDYRKNRSENITLPWKDDFIAVWDESENGMMLLGRKNEVWSMDVTTRKSKLLFKVLVKE